MKTLSKIWNWLKKMPVTPKTIKKSYKKWKQKRNCKDYIYPLF